MFIAVILLTGTENRLYAQKDEQVSWSKDLQLEWADFKGISNRSTDIKAMTNSGISFGVQCIQGDLDLKVDAIFKPQLSWVKEDRSDELLEHERLHFDITELYARMLIQKLTELKDPCGKDLEKMDRIYDDLITEYDAFQERYDRETDHSRNKEKQKEWNEKIKTELDRLQAYSTEFYK